MKLSHYIHRSAVTHVATRQGPITEISVLIWADEERFCVIAKQQGIYRAYCLDFRKAVGGLMIELLD